LRGASGFVNAGGRRSDFGFDLLPEELSFISLFSGSIPASAAIPPGRPSAIAIDSLAAQRCYNPATRGSHL